MTGMDVTESLADMIVSFNPVNHFDRFLVLTNVILVLTTVTLVALKCILTYIGL